VSDAELRHIPDLMRFQIPSAVRSRPSK
jgi:hypothetical protein